MSRPLKKIKKSSLSTRKKDYFTQLDELCIVLEPIIQDLRSKGFIETL